MIWLRVVLFVFLALFALVGCQQYRLTSRAAIPPKGPDHLRLATWNVHYIWLEQAEGPWGLSGWEARKGPMDARFKSLGADIVAFQEMESFSRRGDGNTNLTRDWLLSQNPDYAAAATGDARQQPPTQPIFYRVDRYKVIEDGWFFFSETPDVLYSRGFDGSSPSFCSWVIFEEIKSGTRFRVVNIHPDALSRVNKAPSVALTADRMRPWFDAGETVILAGDFNARHGSSILAVFEEIGITFPKVPGATFHMNRGLHLFGAIDHIGVSNDAMLMGEPVVVNAKPEGGWPSDHHPVLLDLRLP